jgi:hypothetical protein
MFNAASKKFRIPALAVLAAAALASCGPGAEERAAAELLGQAEALYDLKDYSGAIDSINSLDARYRGFTDLRRAGLRLRALATEALVKDSIEAVEPELARATIACDSLKALFEYTVPAAEGLDGYYLPKGLKAANAVSATGIQPRVDTEGYFYLTANINGRVTGLTTVSITSGSDTWTSTPISPARVLTVEGSEIASLSPEECAGLGTWLAAHEAKGLKGSFNGAKGKVDFSISPALRDMTLLCVEYSEAQLARRAASVQREKLERKLQAVRDRLANMPLPSQD